MHLNIAILVSSEEMPNALPTEFKRQDRLMLSNPTTTTLRKEFTRKGGGNFNQKKIT